MKMLIHALLEAKQWLPMTTLQPLALEYAKKLYPNAKDMGLGTSKTILKVSITGVEDMIYCGERYKDFWLLDQDFYDAMKDKLPPHDVLVYRQGTTVQITAPGSNTVVKKDKFPDAKMRTLALEYAKKLHPEVKPGSIALKSDKKSLQVYFYVNDIEDVVYSGEKVGKMWLLDKQFYEFVKSELPPHDPLEYKGVIQIEI